MRLQTVILSHSGAVSHVVDWYTGSPCTALRLIDITVQTTDDRTSITAQLYHSTNNGTGEKYLETNNPLCKVLTYKYNRFCS